MKLISNIKGFTLVETLVAINLSFIGITFIVSFYLFVFRFTQTISENYTHKYIYQNLFYNLENSLRKSDNYKVDFSTDHIILSTENSDTLLIYKDSLSLNNILVIPALENLAIHIHLFNGEELSITPGGLLDFQNNETVINSMDIKSLKFEIEKAERLFHFEIFTQAIPVKRFINIIKD